MPLVLDPEVVLEKRGTEILMYKQYRDRRENYPIIRLEPASAVVLCLFDGRRSISEIHDILRSAFHSDTTSAHLKLQAVMGRYSSFLLQEDSLVNDKYNPVDFVLIQDRPEPKSQRLDSPFSLTFYLTRYCSRRCVYCAIDTRFGHQAKDACLTLERMKELFDEAADIGVSYIDLTGGDPFLRDDIIDILGYLVQKRLKFNISTKFALKEKDAQNLQSVGVNEVIISIDSHRPEMADFLSGTTNFYKDTIGTIKWLKESSLDVVAFPVLTNLTIKEFPAYVDFFTGLGVDIIRPGVYQKTRHPRWDRLLSCHDQDLIEVAEFCSKTRKKIKIDTRLLSGNETKRCESGLSNLIVTPDGKTAYCNRLLEHQQLLFGDLTTQSIMEIWNSSHLLSLVYPYQEKFKGTECHTCGDFSNCYHEGVCFYLPYISQSVLFAPYNNCPRMGSG